MLPPASVGLRALLARRAPVGYALRLRRQLNSSTSSRTSSSSVGLQAAARAATPATAATAGAGPAAASAASNLQAESGTWCRRVEESKEMKAWAEPIVEEVVGEPCRKCVLEF